MSKIGDWTRSVLGAPLRLLIPKNPWLRLLLLLLVVALVAAFVEPLLSLLGKGLDLIARIFTPLLADPVGRLVLLNLILFVVLLVTLRMLRARWTRLRSGLLLRRHLRGIHALLREDRANARELLLGVAKQAARAPAECPWLGQDAALKVARLALAEGDPDLALGQLARVRTKGLPKELLRSHAQLRAEASLAQGEILPEAVEAELRAALEQNRDDRRTLALLARVHRERGEHAAAAELQARIVALTPEVSAGREREVLVADWVAAGQQALATGDVEGARGFARRARKADRDATAPGLLLGDVHAAAGEARNAIREWGATRSPDGFARIVELLDRQPGLLSARELAEASPMEGTLLLVAREYARAGDHAHAMRAATLAARKLGPTPTVTRLLAEVLELCGRDAEARELREEAVLRLLGEGA